MGIEMGNDSNFSPIYTVEFDKLPCLCLDRRFSRLGKQVRECLGISFTGKTCL